MQLSSPVLHVPHDLPARLCSHGMEIFFLVGCSMGRDARRWLVVAFKQMSCFYLEEGIDKPWILLHRVE